MIDVPTEIGTLKQLKILRLGSNELKTVPASLGDLTNLEILDLSDNELKTLPESLTKLTNLKQLLIGGNPLPAELVEKFRAAMPNTRIQ